MFGANDEVVGPGPSLAGGPLVVADDEIATAAKASPIAGLPGARHHIDVGSLKPDLIGSRIDRDVVQQIRHQRKRTGVDGGNLRGKSSQIVFDRTELALETSHVTLENSDLSLQGGDVTLSENHVGLEGHNVGLCGCKASLLVLDARQDRGHLPLQSGHAALKRRDIQQERRLDPLDGEDIALEGRHRRLRP